MIYKRHELNNRNRGAGFMEDNGQQLTVRVPGTLNNVKDIENVSITTKNGFPVRVAVLQRYRLGMTYITWRCHL